MIGFVGFVAFAAAVGVCCFTLIAFLCCINVNHNTIHPLICCILVSRLPHMNPLASCMLKNHLYPNTNIHVSVYNIYKETFNLFTLRNSRN